MRTTNRNALESLQMVMAAQRFYVEGANKSAIAAELGVSRFKVARLLSNAVDDKIITFEIHAPSDVDVNQSMQINDIYGLRQTVVLRLLEGPEEFRRRQLGQACAPILGELLVEGDIVGVSWGRTLHAMVRMLPDLPKCTVVQVVGTVPTSDLRINSLDLVRDIGDRSGGPIHALHVPMVVDNQQTAARLRHEPHVRQTVEMFGNLTKAIVGIGAWRPPQSSLLDAVPQSLVATLRESGAVADICATVLDDDGRELLAGDLAGRSIAISAAELAQVPDVIAIVGGASRAQAIRAALRSGLVHRLITDDETAAALLALPSSPNAKGSTSGRRPRAARAAGTKQ